MFHPDGPSLVELTRQALSSTERGYDLLAPKFDRTPFRTPDALLAPFFAHVFTRGPVASALDVACGTGAQLRHLAPFVSGRLVGLDFSQGMLDEARRQLADVARLELVRHDARALPYAADFELVTSAGAFGHFVGPDEDLLLDGVRRALVPGGRFVFLTTPYPKASSAGFWLAGGFNAAMNVRNALVKPPFVMRYLTFTWPEVAQTLAQHGFVASARDGLVEGRLSRVVAVTAEKRR
ncbi:MAG: class I SAM-dependent methyltransferase [Myxococcaceae bacterium]|jgi:ubiquinone/menaquinone biosynthesis C-methylase UbiE|nr:class I SAM-dependent methyltransferase [Myxococcaceae bacterium]